jgi:hypothetical protein
MQFKKNLSPPEKYYLSVMRNGIKADDMRAFPKPGVLEKPHYESFFAF